jgi:hypothetical protein
MATYQTNVAPISDTLAHFQAWGQFFGAGFTTIGWQAQTGHGEVAATGTGASYAWTTVSLPTTALTPQTNYNFRGAWVSGTTYTGSNTANAANVDVVTSGGVTYAHITATSSLTTAPGSDTTNWQPLIFEIWKSNGTQSASFPIYVKIVYTVASTAGTAVRYMLSIGTGVDTNGNLTGAMTLAAAAPVTVAPIDNATTTSSTVGEMDFSGDADNARWITWRGGPAAGWQSIFVIDRSKTSSGTDSNAYAFVGSIYAIGGTTRSSSAVLMGPSLGGILSSTSNSSPGGWPGAIYTAGLTSTVNFGGVPPFPIFPIVGFLANPLLGCVGFTKGDVTDGTQLPVWIYSTTHNYLVMSNNAANALFTVNAQANGVCPAILWE